MSMASCNSYKYLDDNPDDGCPHFWTYKRVLLVASLSLIFLLITVSLKPWTFLFISMLTAWLTMSFDSGGAFVDYLWRVFTIVAIVFMLRFFIWCAQKLVKRPRNEDEDEDDVRNSVYVSWGLIVIFALVFAWCVKKLQKPRRRRGV